MHGKRPTSFRKSDVLVVGGGPAGLFLASELAERGLRTTVVASRLGETWDRSYGAFAKDLSTTEVDGAVKRSFARPLVQVSSRPPLALSEVYLRFDTGALQASLFERAERAGVEFLSGTVDGVEINSQQDSVTCLARLAPGPGESHHEDRPRRLSARLIVNASGGALRGQGEHAVRPVGYQSAYGEWIEVPGHEFAAQEMTLMDYRPSGTEPESREGPASFLYALPETGEARGPGTIFVQETVLVSEAPVPMSLLRDRLGRRLASLGLLRERTLGTERCVIPLGGALPDPSARILPFGAAAGFVHPATGYQLATAFRLAPSVAEVVAEGLSRGKDDVVSSAILHMWPENRRRAYRFYELGALTLATLDGETMESFIGDFFSLRGGRWQRFMSGSMDAAEIAETMWRIFAHARGNLRAKLLRGGSTVTSRLLVERMN